MYTTSDLSVFPYFAPFVENASPSALLDSLTGVIARPHMLGFIHDLIDRGQEFTLAMVDLDNFKSFNDNYGHSVGDQVLSTVASKLMHFMKGRGLVGRFGGDEFILVSFLGQDYDSIHDFYFHLYYQNDLNNLDCVFRRDVIVEGKKLFVTATVGSATFPKDARNFDSLFSLVDITLYRGKSKGRNCYIIYVPEKHAHLDIPKLARHSLYDAFQEIASAFDSGASLMDRLHLACEPLLRNLRFHFLFHVDPSGRVWDAKDQKEIGFCEDLSGSIRDGYAACSGLDDIAVFPRLQTLLQIYDIHSLLILSIGPVEKKMGFLVLSPEPHTLHLWQDGELAAGFVLARLSQEQLWLP